MTSRIAVVTGGAQGIGLACAKALQEDGCQIVLADINADGVATAVDKLGQVARGFSCDMGDLAAISALFDEIETDIGPASVVVNNAGIALPGDFLDYDLEDFQRVISVNLTGVFAATQRAAKTMVAQGLRGAIVIMSSINAQLAIPSIAPRKAE